MQYDPQVSLFLKNIPKDPAPNGTTTQKLIALLNSDVQAVQDNAMMALTSATAQGNNADLARDEGLIPVFLEQLQVPRRQKDASFAFMMLATKAGNVEALNASGKWTTAIEILAKLPSPPPELDVPKNLLAGLHYLTLNEKIRETMGQTANLKVIVEYAGKRANPAYVEKALAVIANLSNAKSTKESIKDAGGIPILVNHLGDTKTPAIRDSALKALYQVTASDKNREAMRQAGALKPLVAALDAPNLSADLLAVALNCLRNLAVDAATTKLLAENDLFGPLVKQLESKNPKIIEQTAICLQNMVNESSLSSMAKAGAYEGITKCCKASTAFLPQLSLVYASVIADVDVQARFVETGGPAFLLSFFDYNNAELNKQACRGIGHVTELYDDIRAAIGTETGLKHLLRLSQGTDKQIAESALNALINLARYEPIGLLLNKMGGLQFIAQLVDSKDKATMINASMILVNLSRFASLNALLTSMGWIDKAMTLIANPDPDVQAQGAKLLINFAMSGRNRKYVHDKGLMAKIKTTKNSTTNANAKNQLEIAVNNLSFPYEERYEGLDFALEDKLPISKEAYDYGADSDEEDKDMPVSQKRLTYNKLVEDNKIKLENERKRVEKERKEAEAQLKQQQLQREKKRKEEEDQLKKKKAEEERQRALKKTQEEQAFKKKQAEAEKRRIEEAVAAAKKATEERLRLEQEEAKRIQEEEERKKKKHEEANKKVEQIKRRTAVLPKDELAAKLKRKEERRVRNEDRQKRRDAHAKKRLEKAQKREEKQKRRAAHAEKKALKLRAKEDAARAQKDKEEEEARVKLEGEERAKREKSLAEEEARLKREHEEKEKKRKAELEALEKDAKKKEEDAAKEVAKETVTEKKPVDVKDAEKAKAEKRVKITQEILTVEKGYVGNLSIAIRKFLNPLTASAASKKPLLVAEKVKAIFSIIEVIFNYNSLLLEGLETRTKRWIADNKTTPLCFGDIFVKMTDYMACYSTYINNYDTSMATLIEAKKQNLEFAQFLKKAEADPECRMQELSSFIINPIQQLPRYIMLLTDLLKNTATDHPDYANVGVACEKMKKLTVHVNEQKRESETTAAIVNIQHRLRGKAPSLLVPFRKLVKEGAVEYPLFSFSNNFSTLMCGRLGDATSIKDKEGFVFLFNDLVVLAKQKNSSLLYKDSFPVTGLTVEDLKDDQIKNVKNAFLVKAAKPVLMSTKSPIDKSAWLQKINASINGKLQLKLECKVVKYNLQGKL